MLHEPASPVGNDPAASFKMRLGVWMFLLYLVLYSGFVFINLYNAAWMEIKVLMGLNLATVYGMGLIIAALIQALIYNAICSKREHAMAEKPNHRGSR